MSKLFNSNFLTDIYGITDIIKSNDYQLKDIGDISKQLTEKTLESRTVSENNKISTTNSNTANRNISNANPSDNTVNRNVSNINNINPSDNVVSRNVSNANPSDNIVNRNVSNANTSYNIVNRNINNANQSDNTVSRNVSNINQSDNTVVKTVMGSTNDMVNKSVGVPPLQVLELLRKEIENCSKCRLSASRTNVVFGDGNVFAKLLFIGEGPGADEDKAGLPFIGRAGQLLTKMIIAMGFKKEDVYIANIVKCRPPNNRNPFEDETACCIPYLHKQIATINPDYIIALGSIATKYLLNTNEGISSLRGRWQSLSLPNVSDKEYQVMPTFHPAYLLRSPTKKVFVWQDLQLVMKEMGLPVK